MRVRRAVLLVSAATTAFAGACANVIGVAGYKDAIEELCGPCDTIPDCADRLDEGLLAASDDQVHDWLEDYSRLGCANADCQGALFQCFYSAPGLCIEVGGNGGTCGRSEECCGFDFDEPDKGAGCCDGGGTAACCADCKSCSEAVEAYANQLPFDDTALCLSQVDSWNELHACAIKGDNPLNNCTLPCEGGGDMPPTEDACRICLSAKCNALYQACGANAGF
jgi:hypothetical protein